MYTRGEFSIDNVTYGAIVYHSKSLIEAILVVSGTVVSAYKVDLDGAYSYNNTKAKELVKLIQTGLKGCTSKNCVPQPFELGAMNSHEFTKSKVSYTMQLHAGELVGAYIQSVDKRVELSFVRQAQIPSGIPYVKLTDVKKEFETSEDELYSVPVRTVQEIALEKEDVTWLKNKKYYIVNDDETAESLFQFLDNYNGVIAYDTETTGLRINCFGKIGSKYKETLDKYNEEHEEDKIRADRLVGIIFCVETDVSYYFPCFNRKFKNLYQDINSPVRKRIIERIRARYTVGDLRDSDSDMIHYFSVTKDEDISSDVILMERVRDILTTKHIVAHGGQFEHKVGYLYGIMTNVKDDTMLMHQVMYKFRSTTRNSGEPSNLKYLSKRELGIDQWELKDFFPNIKEDKKGTVREKAGAKKKKTGSLIDFSYMDYDGTRIYAPTDGDCTLLLFFKYKKDMVENHKELEYIYSVEVIVSAAIAYMEFFGHRIDEGKILGAREQTRASMALIESEIRQSIGYSSKEELIAYNNLKETTKKIKDLENLTDEKSKAEHKRLIEELFNLCEDVRKAIDSNEEHQLNLSAPAQVADLFYNKLGYPLQGDKPSVAKKVVKALLKEKNSDGTAKCPVAHMYSKYKNEETLMTKFFDALPQFMYPGGFIFSSYGQIAAATGRMSCKQPNAQQYPKIISKIVIPRDGYVMADADYSQIEYRVLTALAKNDELAKLFSDPDSDYHTLMASLMYDVPYSAVTPQMRSAAKSFNFGIPYGMGLGSLAILLTGKNTQQTRDEAAEKYEMYFKNQPKTKQFFNNVKEMAQINKYTKTLFNRYRYYSFVDENGNVNNAKKAAALRQAGNAVIQGCVHGDTMIETKEFGIVKIKEVVNKHLLVWDGNKWSNGDILYSGKKRKCIVTFTNNQKFICSPIHKFLKASTDAYDELNYIECKDLKAGDLIEYNELGELKIEHFRVIKSFDFPTELEYTDEHNEIDKEVIEPEHGLMVESVEITDEYIDMYDVCNTDGGYYVADGIITHNTAADIFKIGVARNFNYIKENNLFGKVLITNMVHDEQLLEIDVQSLNAQRIVTDVGKNMQFKIDGFPPLYIGAGIGKAWGYAKGKMAEIHPVLLEQMTEESKSLPIFKDNTSEHTDPNKVIKYFNERVVEFRKQKIIDYLSNSSNWNKTIHPAIGGLINLQFNYGRGDDAKAYVGPNGETYNDAEFLELNLSDFIEENHIDVKVEWFKGGDKLQDEEEDSEYSDEEDGEDLDIDGLGSEYIEQFKAIDESDKVFGSGIHDLIKIFGTCILLNKKICGINTMDMYFKKKDAIIDYITGYVCDGDEDGAVEIVFLTDANVLKHTGVYVKGLSADELQKKYKQITHTRY